MSWYRQSVADAALVLFLISSLGYADLDWGGGITQFQAAEGTPLTPATGLAVLVAVGRGGLVDLAAACPQTPANLVIPGAVVTSGDSQNLVLATAGEFHDGYLLLSATADLDTAAQQALGAVAGQGLYLVVWERASLLDGVPVDGSRFAALQLFENGLAQRPATTFGPALPQLAAMVYPDLNQAVVRCQGVRNTQAESLTVRLYPGWNLVSTPLALPNPSLAAVFGALPVTVWSWVSGAYVAPARIEPARGYWVHYAEQVPVDVVLQGHRPEDTALHLDAGWNLVGPVVGTPTPASLRERLWSWDAQTRTYQADGGTLEVGHGYWIHAVAPQDISVP